MVGRPGGVGRGANIAWLSEFPEEEEILFVPLTAIDVRSSRVEGAVQVYEISVTVRAPMHARCTLHPSLRDLDTPYQTRPMLRSITRLVVLLSSSLASAMRVAVFGGSGFVGSRTCRTLSELGCDVLSISRSGRPPAWAAPEPWAADIEWLAWDAASTDAPPKLGDIDAAVSCVGNVRPAPNWEGFWGLHWDNEAMRRENGDVNEAIVDVAASAGAERFVYISVDYNTAKAIEGPIEGYLDGKRAAETAAHRAFGDRCLVVGPSLVCGGGRGGGWLAPLLESGPVKAYAKGNAAIASLSSSALEDFVSKMVLSPPVDVDVLARVVAAGALGTIGAGMLPPRKQGFWDTKGKPAPVADVPYVDGTFEIRRVAQEAATPDMLAAALPADGGGGERAPRSVAGATASAVSEAPPLEGALVGWKPLLYPWPVAIFFVGLFQWATALPPAETIVQP